jgi:hypothetical protein
MKRVAALFAASFAIAASMVQAQENVGEQKDESKNAISIFSGALTDLTADVTGPSVGVGYVRDITGTLHFVAQSEWASANERELAFGRATEKIPVFSEFGSSRTWSSSLRPEARGSLDHPPPARICTRERANGDRERVSIEPF